MQRHRILDYLVYLVVRVFVCVVQAISIETGQFIARGLARLFSDILRIRGAVVDENLAHAYPELSQAERRELARRMWEHLFLLVLEVAHAPRKIHETNWRKHVRLNGTDPLVRALLNDRPTVIVTAHYGNFELGGFMLGVLGFPTYTVARNLDNPYLDRFVNRFRGATGQYIIPKKGGYDQILAVMARGGAMSFLADQYAGPKGCWVEFFGRKASAHKAIALLSLEHDAPVAVCCARRLNKPMQFEMQVLAMADPRQTGAGVGTIYEMTAWYTRKLEAMIREAPEQYWWLHRRWKDPRPPRRSQTARAA
ncbi:MAG: lysophospholipid acyltransferase family protein [Thermoguttaceae bacterium]|nr:lysophospholipid acyltransferase family protein [Thermoguttaceae bacterium]